MNDGHRLRKNIRGSRQVQPRWQHRRPPLARRYGDAAAEPARKRKRSRGCRRKRCRDRHLPAKKICPGAAGASKISPRCRSAGDSIPVLTCARSTCSARRSLTTSARTRLRRPASSAQKGSRLGRRHCGRGEAATIADPPCGVDQVSAARTAIFAKRRFVR